MEFQTATNIFCSNCQLKESKRKSSLKRGRKTCVDFVEKVSGRRKQKIEENRCTEYNKA